MSVYKNPRGMWTAFVRYVTWDGQKKAKKKETFKTKREAQAWEQEFLKQASGNCNMKLGSMAELYMKDCAARLRPTTLETKRSIIDTHILPCLKDLPVNEITPAVVREWQNKLIAGGLADTYLKTINTQLSAIFNYAVKYYNIPYNPVARCGTIGKKKSDDFQMWTLDEFKQFYSCLKREHSKMAFELLFWTGLRVGELLALTYNDFEFENKKVSVTKTYARLKGEDLFLPPKTPKSERSVPVPDFVLEHIKEFVGKLYEYEPDERLFPFTKATLKHEMENTCKVAGVTPIKIHALRHSYASMLIEQGCEPLIVSELLGHESVSTTLEIYAHLYPNKHGEVLKKLEDLGK